MIVILMETRIINSDIKNSRSLKDLLKSIFALHQ